MKIVGDIVKLKKHGQGGTYSTYEKLAKKLKINNWHRAHLPPYDVLYKIKAIADSENIEWITDTSASRIAYIEQIKTKRGYLINIDCLEQVNEFLSEDDMLL